MRVVQREGLEIDECPAGHGVWLDSGELRTMVDSMVEPRSERERELALGRRSDAARLAAVRVCPRCSQEMERVEYDVSSGVQIDTCVDHGVWCDAGELERLESWIEAHRAKLEPLREALNPSTPEIEARDAAWEQAQAAGEEGRFSAIAAAFRYWRATSSRERSRPADPDTGR